MHYGVITNMAAIDVIHLFIYECIISQIAPLNREPELFSLSLQFLFSAYRTPSKSEREIKKWFPPFSRAYNNRALTVLMMIIMIIISYDFFPTIYFSI